MATITFWAGEGCLLSGITGLMDAFSIANLWQAAMGPAGEAPLFETRVVTNDGQPVRAYGGIEFNPTGALATATASDCIIVPPFLPHVDPIPDRVDDLTPETLKNDLHEKGHEEIEIEVIRAGIEDCFMELTG